METHARARTFFRCGLAGSMLAVSLLPLFARLARAAGKLATEGTLSTITYSVDQPCVLVQKTNSPLAIRVTPEKALYRAGELPKVEIETEAIAGATVLWRVMDGFGRELSKGTGDGNSGLAKCELEGGYGYYEIIATLQKDGQTLVELRRSIGELTPPAPAQ